MMTVRSRARGCRSSHFVAAATAVLLALTGLFYCSSTVKAEMQVESFSYVTAEEDGSRLLRSGVHPDETTASFAFSHDEEGTLLEAPRDIRVDLPAGAVGNPALIETCTQGQFANFGACPVDTQVGVAHANIAGSFFYFPIYNLVAPPGELAQFAFYALNTPVHLVATVHSLPEYGVRITARQTPQTVALYSVETTFWGTPASSTHDELRGTCAIFYGSGLKCSSEGPELPFLTNPSACTPTSLATANVNSWLYPDFFDRLVSGNVDGEGRPLGVVGCAATPFEPSFEARPTTAKADSPSGLHFHLHLPQVESTSEPATAQLRDATVRFPDGLTVNPASAAGLEACSAEQVGLLTAVGNPAARFDEEPSSCPDASKLGNVEIKTPVLKSALQGAVYLATPHENPFGTLLGLYIVVEDPQTGVLMKIAGKAEPDSSTGRLTATFPEAPQLPFEDLDLSLFAGSRAALRTPSTCGTFQTNGEMVPWSTPEGPTRDVSDSFPVSASADGGSCPTSGPATPNRPTFSAGTANPAAGSYSPFVLKLGREDGSQPIKGLEATLPQGLLGRLAGVPYCSDASLAAAATRPGLAEQASPSCSAASRVGTVSVAAGAGSTPLYVTGNAYLAGPYKGAPLSLAVVTPAVAGPFDLGTVVVRNALRVDPETTQITVVSDPIPTILQGVPLDIRRIAVSIDRPSFTLNPTNCEAAQITGSALSVFDQSAPLTEPFAVGGCGALGFKPKLSLSMSGGTNRRGHPALRALVTYPKGAYANIARAQVSLPGDMLLDQSHIGTVCTRPKLASQNCPPRSIYGYARAWSPLLAAPLKGPVYLVPSSHKLPDLLAELNGQIRVLLRGRVDSAKATHGLRNTFEAVPDAPISRFELRLEGGKRGLIQNEKNLCATPQFGNAAFTAQNGKIADSKPKIAVHCKAKTKKKAHAGKHRHHPDRLA